jgi:KDO2-lipid IV(A) lauroyltransferase
MFVLQTISRASYCIIYYLIGYRKKIVEKNLRIAFPEKSDQEIRKIQKAFFKHLSDVFIETLYLLSMSKKEVTKRYKIGSLELLNKYYAEGKDIVVVTSHFGNWEWAASGWLHLPYNTIGVYKPLSNKLIDKFMVHLRSVYGSPVIPMKNTLRTIINARKKDDRFALYLIGDQRPLKTDIQHWVNFFNQDTPVITGPEKIARKFNTVFAFLEIEQVKRGYYKANFKIISENPAEMKEHEMTEKYFQLVEEQIRKKPELYLWSHNRWKFKREEIMENS